jgi:beta-lactamase regulating signal transducer with metallopeptidase domain
VNWVDHIWQSSVVAAAILIFLMVARPLPSKTRRAIAWIGLAKFAIPMPKMTAGGSNVLLGAMAQGIHTAVNHFLLTTGRRPPSAALLPILGAVVLAGAALCFGVCLIHALRLRGRLLAGAAPAAPALRLRVDAAAARAGLARAPLVRIVPSDQSPGVLGLWSPILLLPMELESALSAPELDSILLHECVHAVRRDNLWAAAEALFLSLNWYNPLVWLLCRQINIETEHSCDERVLELFADRSAYLQAIAKTVRHSLGLAARRA